MSVQTPNLSAERARMNQEFFRRFEHEKASLQELITRLNDTAISGSERTDLETQCLSSISHISDTVRDASSHLPAHDQRTYSTAVKTLTQKVQAARSASAPKRKFAFKKPVPQKSTEEPRLTTTEQNANVSPLGRDAAAEALEQGLRKSSGFDVGSGNGLAGNLSNLIISSLSSKIYILQESAFRPAAQLTNIDRSYVDLSISMIAARPFSTLSIKGASESLLVCGQVSGPAHITSVENSTLIIWSRQVRIHECKNCVLYLRCSSRPIIEDCAGILFAPLPDFIGSPAAESAAAIQPNLWDQVDDFKWLRAQHSPNWAVLPPEDERAINSEGWETITATGKSHLGLDELLRAAKVFR